MFRGWRRLVIHATSLNTAEGAFASATASSRAAWAEAMEAEAAAAAKATAAWTKAADASAEATAAMTAKAKALQEAAGRSSTAVEVNEQEKRSERALRLQAQRHAILLVRLNMGSSMYFQAINHVDVSALSTR